MTAPTKLWHLENLQVLHSLTPAERQHLHERSHMQTFARGEAIYFASDHADSIYVLKTGKVKIVQRSPAGQEVTVALLGAGDLFGELTLSGGEFCGEEAVALQETLVCQFQAADYQALLTGNAHLHLEVTRLVGQRLQKVQHRLCALVFKSAEERIRDLLRELGREHGRCVANDPEQVVVKLQLTHQDLARLAATSRQTVSTLLGKLHREGTLTYNRRSIFIRRLQAL